MTGWADWAGRPEVEPSLYAADFGRLRAQVDALLDAGARVFHFDVGDGHFIREITIGPVVLASIAPAARERGAVFDCHLMVAEPERHFEALVDAGGDSVTFHVEARPDPRPVVEHARDLGLGAGIAFNPDTPVDDALAAAETGVDLVLCMSIHPGLSGQSFMPEALGRIEELRRRLPGEVLVQVDGGVSTKHAAALRDAGADLYVAGSAIFWQDDLPAAYDALVDAVSPPTVTT